MTGRVLGLLRERVDVDVVRVVDEVDVGVVEVPHHLFERGGLVVVLLDGAPDRLLGRDHGLDVVSGEELDVVERKNVGRVGGRQDQRRAGPVHGDHGVLDRDLLRDQLDHRRLDLELVEIDRGHAVLLGDEVGELVLVEEAELGDLRAEPSALRAGLLTRLAQLLRAEEILLDEKLPDPLVHADSPDSALRNPNRNTRLRSRLRKESVVNPVGYRRSGRGALPSRAGGRSEGAQRPRSRLPPDRPPRGRCAAGAAPAGPGR